MEGTGALLWNAREGGWVGVAPPFLPFCRPPQPSGLLHLNIGLTAWHAPWLGIHELPGVLLCR